MTTFFSLAQKPVLEEVQAQLQNSEAVLAPPCDTYIVATQDRLGATRGSA